MADFEFPWERRAMTGAEMPDGLPLPDQMAYIAMRGIYRAFNRQALTRDAAAAEKKKVRREYEKMAGEWKYWGNLARYHCDLRKNIEAAEIACRKDPTQENAMRLCDVIDGMEV